MEVLVQPLLAKVEQETKQIAMEKIQIKMEQDGEQNSGKLGLQYLYRTNNDI